MSRKTREGAERPSKTPVECDSDFVVRYKSGYFGATATGQAHNVMLVLNYDLIYEIDPQTRQTLVIQ